MPSPEALCVDIGGTKTRVAVVSGDRIIENTTREFPTAKFAGGDQLVQAVCEHTAIGHRELRGIGICAPGLLAEDRASLEFCPNTPALAGYPLFARLRERSSLPVKLEVDCNAAALAESRFGAITGLERFVVISLGTGVGVGVVDRGKIVRLTAGCFGDLGHIYVGGDRRCSAGCRGCLESKVSVEALSNGGETAPEFVAALIQRAKAGHAHEVSILEAAGYSIGIAVASMSSFLRPDVVLLVGGISEAGDCLTESATRAFRDYAAPFYLCPIHKGRFGCNAALIGAGLAMLEDS